MNTHHHITIAADTTMLYILYLINLPECLRGSHTKSSSCRHLPVAHTAADHTPKPGKKHYTET